MVTTPDKTRYRLLGLAFWLSLVLLLPLLLWQGSRARRTILRLPEAEGEAVGRTEDSSDSSGLLLLGESTAVGVGVEYHRDGLLGHLVRGMVLQYRRAVHWQLCGKNGARLHEVLAQLKTTDTVAADLIVLAIGANDAKALCSPRQWRDDLQDMLHVLRARYPATPICLSAMPPMGQFPALPRPLRTVLGWHTQRLDMVSTEVCQHFSGVRHLPLGLRFSPELFARDGFHPSSAGYALWAENLLAAMKH